MSFRAPTSLAALLFCPALAVLSGCGADQSDDAASSADERSADAGTRPGGGAPSSDASSTDDTFVPEQEEFLVREVASTDRYVFVPNSSPDSSTIARIDGRDLSVVPIRVGREPVAVRAAHVDGVGSVAYVLSEGTSTVAVVRADQIERGADTDDYVSLLRVPAETNALATSPDGRHLIAYVDPSKPVGDTSVTSLQAASLIRLGDSSDEDRVFELSVSRLIDEIAFTDDGRHAFIVGRDGINHLDLEAINEDTFVPPLDLDLSSSAFPPADREVEVDPNGEFLVIRSSAYEGLALYRLPDEGSEGQLLTFDLPGIPTDIDLHTPSDSPPQLVASIREPARVALVDVEAAIAAGAEGEQPDSAIDLLEVSAADPGLATMTPDRTGLLLYTTLAGELRPRLGLLDLDTRALRTFELRNQIRSVAVSPDSDSAVVVHRNQSGPPDSETDPLEFFRHNYGLTIVDLATGYRRPITLQADPARLVLAEADDRTHLFAMLQSTDPERRGVMRIDLSSYRTDFLGLSRPPDQIGRVAGKLFVSQTADSGRITFFDIATGRRQTVSGYELNAGIR